MKKINSMHSISGGHSGEADTFPSITKKQYLALTSKYNLGALIMSGAMAGLILYPLNYLGASKHALAITWLGTVGMIAGLDFMTQAENHSQFLAQKA